jgi:hypothetical protein
VVDSAFAAPSLKFCAPSFYLAGHAAEPRFRGFHRHRMMRSLFGTALRWRNRRALGYDMRPTSENPGCGWTTQPDAVCGCHL